MQEFIRTGCFAEYHKGRRRATRICDYSKIFVIRNTGSVSEMVVAYVDVHK